MSTTRNIQGRREQCIRFQPGAVLRGRNIVQTNGVDTAEFADHEDLTKLADAVEQAPRPDPREPLALVAIGFVCVLELPLLALRAMWRHPMWTICGAAGGVMLAMVLKR